MFVLNGPVLNAQQINDDPARPQIHKAGEIFTVKVTPGASRIEISLANSPMATVTPESVRVFTRVIPRSGKAKEIKFVASGSVFETREVIEKPSTLEIKIEDKRSKKTETLYVPIHQP